MNQSKLGSLIESLINTLIGYVINLIVQLIVYPAFGATFTFKQNIFIGFIFMAVSIVRSYTIRRYCNSLHATANSISHLIKE